MWLQITHQPQANEPGTRPSTCRHLAQTPKARLTPLCLSFNKRGKKILQRPQSCRPDRKRKSVLCAKPHGMPKARSSWFIYQPPSPAPEESPRSEVTSPSLICSGNFLRFQECQFQTTPTNTPRLFLTMTAGLRVLLMGQVRIVQICLLGQQLGSLSYNRGMSYKHK